MNIFHQMNADLSKTPEVDRNRMTSGSFSTKGILKIAFLMGSIWLSGFLARLFDSFALQLIYIVSGSCQGIFVFVFFALTAHVRQKLMRRCRSENSFVTRRNKKTEVHKSRSTETDSRGPSVANQKRVISSIEETAF